MHLFNQQKSNESFIPSIQKINTCYQSKNKNNYIKKIGQEKNKKRKHSLSSYDEACADSNEYAFEKEILSWSSEPSINDEDNHSNDIFAIESTQKLLSFLNFD